MSYTREQLEAIKKKLLLSAKKDTQLPTVEFLDGTEIVPIVKQGSNQVTTVEAILSLVESPFTTISHPKLVLSEAIKLTPERNRKPGAIISFRSKDTNEWVLFQFRSDNEKYFIYPEYWEELFSNHNTFNLKSIDDLNKIKAEVGQLELVLTENGLEVFEFDCKKNWVNLFPKEEHLCIGYRDIPELRIVCDDEPCGPKVSKPYRRGNSVYWINEDGLEEWLFDVDDNEKPDIDDRPIPEPRYEVFLTADPVEGTGEVSTTYRWKILRDGVIVEPDSVMASGQDLKANPVVKYTRTQQQLVTITIDGHELTKIFQIKVASVPLKKYTVTVDTDDFGSYTPILQSSKYDEGTTLTIHPVPLAGFRFKEWIVNGTSITTPVYTFTVTQNMVIQGKFEAIPPRPTYTIKTEVRNGVGGMTSPVNRSYPQNSVVDILATPMEGYEFKRWETKQGVLVSTTPIYSINLTEDKCFVAVFEEKVVTPPLPPVPDSQPTDKGKITALPGETYTISGDTISVNNLCRIDGEGLEYFEVELTIDQAKELIDNYEINLNGIPDNAVVITISQDKRKATMKFYCKLLKGIKPVIKFFDKFRRWIQVLLSDFLSIPDNEEPPVPQPEPEKPKTKTIRIEFSGIEDADKDDPEFDLYIREDSGEYGEDGTIAEVDVDEFVEMEVETPEIYDIRRIYWKETNRKIHTGTIDNYVLAYSKFQEDEFTIVVEVYKKEVAPQPEQPSCDIRLQRVQQYVGELLQQKTMLKYEGDVLMFNSEFIEGLDAIEREHKVLFNLNRFYTTDKGHNVDLPFGEAPVTISKLKVDRRFATYDSLPRTQEEFEIVVSIVGDITSQDCFNNSDKRQRASVEKILFTNTEAENSVTKTPEKIIINIKKDEVPQVDHDTDKDCDVLLDNLYEEITNIYYNEDYSPSLRSDGVGNKYNKAGELHLFTERTFKKLKDVADKYNIVLGISFGGEKDNTLEFFVKDGYEYEITPTSKGPLQVFTTDRELDYIHKFNIEEKIEGYLKNNKELFERITIESSSNTCLKKGDRIGLVFYKRVVTDNPGLDRTNNSLRVDEPEDLNPKYIHEFLIYTSKHSRAFQDFKRDTKLGLAFPSFHIYNPVGTSGYTDIQHQYWSIITPALTSIGEITTEPKVKEVIFNYNVVDESFRKQRRIALKKNPLRQAWGIQLGDAFEFDKKPSTDYPIIAPNVGDKRFYIFNDADINSPFADKVEGPIVGKLPGSNNNKFNGQYVDSLVNASGRAIVEHAKYTQLNGRISGYYERDRRLEVLSELQSITVIFRDGSTKTYTGFNTYDFLGDENTPTEDYIFFMSVYFTGLKYCFFKASDPVEDVIIE